MRKTIAGLMAQGMSLEDIHMQMEEIFNEEYKKREQEQKALEIAAMRDRAARALVDYMNAVLGDILDEPIKTEGAAELLDEAIEATRMKLDIMQAFGMPIRNDDDEALYDFLSDLGLIQPKK